MKRDYESLPPDARVGAVEIANLTSRSRLTVWRWCQSGKLPKPTPVVPGAVPTWRWGDVKALLSDKPAEVAQ